MYISAFPAQFPLPRRVVSSEFGGGDPPLQACRDSAGTPRTRVRLEPAIDKTCRPLRLQSEMSGFDLCLPPNTVVIGAFRPGVAGWQGAEFGQ